MENHKDIYQAANSVLSLLPNTFGNPEAWRDVLREVALQADVGHSMIAVRDENFTYDLDVEC